MSKSVTFLAMLLHDLEHTSISTFNSVLICLPHLTLNDFRMDDVLLNLFFQFLELVFIEQYTFQVKDKMSERSGDVTKVEFNLLRQNKVV